MSRRPFVVVFSSALPRPPSAAEPLTPPFGFPGRPAGRPGPQPGPVVLGDVPGSSALVGAGRVGPGPGSGRAGGPDPASTSGVSTTGRGGGCGASRVRDAGLRPHCSHPLGVTLLLCLPGVGVSAAWTISRGPAGRSEPTGGRSALPRRHRAARWEPCGAAWLRLRRAPAHFFAPSSALAWVEPRPSASPPAGAAGRD